MTDRDQLARALGCCTPSEALALRRGQGRHALDVLRRQAARLAPDERAAAVEALAVLARTLDLDGSEVVR